MHPYLEHIGPIPFAHRGGASEAPENTLAAFRDAWSLGYKYLETDVHATKDGVLVAFHDPDLTRTCSVNARISDLTFDEVSKVRVHGDHSIPLMAELLEEFPAARFNIDCKSDQAVQPLIDLLQQQRFLERVCIGSFKDSRLKAVRSSFGEKVCTSMGPKQVARLLASSYGNRKWANRLRGVVAQVPMSQIGIPIVTKKSVTVAKDHSIPVHVWTIDDAAEIHRLLDIGVDGIMSDRTRLLKDIFIQRGVWQHNEPK